MEPTPKPLETLEQEPIKGNPILDLYEANRKCADCNSENPRMISVNNGITLCEKCAEEHKKLGNSISYIRKLTDPIDEYILNFFKKGGNGKFKFTCDTLKIDLSLPIEKKYKTYGLDYYRRNLKNKVLGEKEIEIDFPLDKVNEEVVDPINIFPEFDNYGIKNEEDDSIFKNATEWLNIVGNKLKFLKDKISNKIDEIQIKDKIKSGGNAALNGLKNAGSFIVEKTAPGREKIALGVSKIGEGVSNTINKVKDKIKGEQKESSGNVESSNQEKSESNSSDTTNQS